ncbi:MAG: hypothetical protein A2428_13790 [Bdellovibrionales bacterium RIFOXYC1_FULL_54_43]|nr:MAG: hypothetical protein A2428_13790 [Bdellovibrionales bacterium RIFOXYC1_FULL_54_43]HLE01621.1 hypothetical protein [Bdellovibrionota bacterium]
MLNERAFIHAVSNPLSTVHFILDGTLESLRLDPNSKALASQLEEMKKALDQAISLLRARREELIQASKPPGHVS